jgi:hypothetical protein
MNNVVMYAAVDMLTFAMDHPPPETVILISGDRDFSYVLSNLRLRQYQVVVLAPTIPFPHISLRSQACLFLDWNIEILSKAASDSLPRQVPPSTSMIPCLIPIPPSTEKADHEDAEWIPISCNVPAESGSSEQRTVIGRGVEQTDLLGLFGGFSPDLSVSHDGIEHTWTDGVRKSILSILGRSPSATGTFVYDSASLQQLMPVQQMKLIQIMSGLGLKTHNPQNGLILMNLNRSHLL